ncbi:MAG: hypothetical protein WBG19_01525 [Thermoplasmata archaeon]
MDDSPFGSSATLAPTGRGQMKPALRRTDGAVSARLGAVWKAAYLRANARVVVLR